MKDVLYRNPHIEIRKSPVHGYGVFAKRNIPADTPLEECPYVNIAGPSRACTEKSATLCPIDPAVNDYCFRRPNRPEYEPHVGYLSYAEEYPKGFSQATGSALGRFKITSAKMGHTAARLPDSAMVLGLAMVYNHNKDENIGYDYDVENRIYKFYTIKDVAKGEELCHDYGDAYWEDRKNNG